jgi:hypothetical protein
MSFQFNLLPSHYSWLIPSATSPIAKLDELVSNGLFPSIKEFLPALVYAILFGIFRKVVHEILIKV